MLTVRIEAGRDRQPRSDWSGRHADETGLQDAYWEGGGGISVMACREGRILVGAAIAQI